MATSEYLRNREVARKTQAPVLQLPAATRRTLIGPATVASVVMMATDAVMILLAFGLALALRVAVVAKFGAAVGAAKIQYWPATLDFFFLGWFMLAFVLVARRYGLYAAGAQREPGPTICGW